MNKFIKYEFTYLWRYNQTTGDWIMIRDSLIENSQTWLKIFQGDEPGEHFKIAKKRPRNKIICMVKK